MGVNSTPAPTSDLSPAQWLRRVHWVANATLMGAGVGSNPIRNQNFLIKFDLAQDLGGLDSSLIH